LLWKLINQFRIGAQPLATQMTNIELKHKLKQHPNKASSTTTREVIANSHIGAVLEAAIG